MTCVRDTDTILLSDPGGALRADVRLDPDASNMLRITPPAADGSGGGLLMPAASVAWLPGMMIRFAGSGVSGSDWLVTDGSLKSRSQYAALFNAIGTRYGQGDGVTTFQLPPTLAPDRQLGFTSVTTTVAPPTNQSIVSALGPVTIQSNGLPLQIVIGSPAGIANLVLYLLRDGSPLVSFAGAPPVANYSSQTGTQGQPLYVAFTDTPSLGQHTYELRVQTPNNTTGFLWASAQNPAYMRVLGTDLQLIKT